MNDNNIWCVYAHINKTNGKIYIGMSSNIKNRWRVSSYDKSQTIRKAFDKYGWDNFDHIILIENLSKIMAQECEKYLIKKYNTQNKEFGYNISPGGELIMSLNGADSPFSKVTYQYDLDGNFIREWACGKDAEKTLGLTSLHACCRGVNRKSGDWQWSYEYVDHMDKYIPPDYSLYNWVDYPKIYKYSVDGDFIEIIDDIHIFPDISFRRSIIECCRGIRVQTDNFIWLFEEDVSDKNIKTAVDKYYTKYRYVNQYDLNGKYIRTFESAKEAANYYGCCKEAINHACSGITRKAVGYQWKYYIDCDGKKDIDPYKNPNCKEIIQYSLDGSYIKVWESIYIANKTFGGRDITNALYSKKSHEAYGYLWFFKHSVNDFRDEFKLHE